MSDAAEPWRPIAPSDGRVEDLALDEVVGQALGTASMCWADVAAAGEFDSRRAGWVLDGLMAYLNRVVAGVIAGAIGAVAPDPVAPDPETGEVEPPLRLCGNERGHWRHPWLDAAGAPGAGMVQRQCPGRPAVAAAFPDHRYVDVLRCYQADGDGPCRRMVVVEQPDGLAEPGDTFGWTVREHSGGGAGEREWRCPRHSVG